MLVPGQRRVERTCYYVKAKGQIWTSASDMETEARLCTVFTLLIKTLFWLRQYSHGPNPETKAQAPCLAGTPTSYCFNQPPSSAAVLLSLSHNKTHTTSYMTFHNSKSVQTKGSKIRTAPGNGSEAAQNKASICTAKVCKSFSQAFETLVP